MSSRKGGLRNALITPHAIERFKDRWRPLDIHDEAPKTMDEWADKCRSVLMGSHEVSRGRVNRVLQIINHGEVARYFSNKNYGLEFIVVKSEDSFVVKTVIWRGHNYRPEDIPSVEEGGAR